MIKNLPFARAWVTLCILCSLFSFNASAQFTSGNVVVLQIGDGTSALTAGASPVFLKEYNTTTTSQSTAVSTVIIPTTGSARLTIGGTATSEGQMTLSSDSTRLVIVGYDTASTAVAPSGIASATLARVIDTLGSLAVVGRVTSSNSIYSANSFRSATRNNSENYWGAGGNSGTYYFGFSSAATTVQSTVANTRVILAMNGNLYFSTGSGTLGVYKITGQPTSASTPTSLVATGANSSPYGFSINSNETVAYIADDRTSAAGGIYRWTLSGTTWTATDTLHTGTNIGARGLTVDWSGTYPAVYATTTDNKLVRWVDSGNASHIYTTLATAPTNTVFRGVTFAPKPICTNPVLSASVTNYTCAGNGAINITVTSGSTPATYAWTGPGSFTASTQNISNLQAGTYTVTATAAGGCAATTTATVANNATAVATVTALGPTVFCAGGSVVLKANTGTGYTYTWKNGTTTIPGAVDSVYTVTTAGSYSVVVTSGVNCTATSLATNVVVSAAPSATITAGGATTFCQGGSVVLTVPSATGNGYVWKLNGTAIAGATSNTYTATASGTYRAVVTNAGTCKDSSSIVVTVNPAPSTTVTASGSTTFCTGGSVQLCVPTATGVSYQWKNASGNIGSATSACYTATAAGVYKVVVTNNTSGCTDSSIATTVTISSGPTANITPAGPIAICQGSSITLHTNNASGLTYQWKINGTNITTGGADSTYTLSAAGSYTVVVSAGVGCSTTSSAVVVSVNPIPSVAATATNVTCFNACNGTATLAGSGTTSPYAYAVGAGVYSATATIGSLCNGTYVFHTKDANGCVKDTSITITQPTAIVPTTTITVPVNCGSTGTVTVAATGGTGTYQYKLGANGTYSANGVFAGLTAGTDTFYVKDANNCTVSSVLTLASSNAPTAVITPAGPISKCQGDTVMLHTNSASGLTYQWKLNGVNVASGGTDSTYIANAAGSYTVTVSAGPGCTTTSVPVVLTLLPTPVPVVTYFADLLSTSAYASYQWNRNGTPIPGATAQSYAPTIGGSYTVTVFGANGCAGISAPVTVFNLGIRGANLQKLNVYPNPTTGIINIDAAVPVNVSLRDMHGRIILQQDNAKMLDISRLADGSYTLHVSGKSGIVIQNIRITKSAQ